MFRFVVVNVFSKSLNPFMVFFSAVNRTIRSVAFSELQFKVDLLIHAGNELRIAYVLLVLLWSGCIKIAIQRSSLLSDFALERIPTSVHAYHFSRLSLTFSPMHPIFLWHRHSTYCFRWIQNIASHFLSWKTLEMFSLARRSWKRWQFIAKRHLWTVEGP